MVLGRLVGREVGRQAGTLSQSFFFGLSIVVLRYSTYLYTWLYTTLIEHRTVQCSAVQSSLVRMYVKTYGKSRPPSPSIHGSIVPKIHPFVP